MFVYERTDHTRTRSSVKPPNSVWPSADQAIETHSGSREFALCAKSGLSSSTIDLHRIANMLTRNAMHCEIVDYVLALQVEDFDALRRSGTQPVTVGREDKGIDNVTCLQRVQVLALVKIPQHRDSVLAT